MPEAVHHTLSVLVENRAGVLARVANLFSRRAYNIYSLAVAPTHDPRFSRITVVVDVESSPLEQIVKQLDKLVNVVAITELAPGSSVERELLVATVKAPAEARAEVVAYLASVDGRVLSEGVDRLVVSYDGHPGDVDAVESRLAELGIVELRRTGRVALPKLDSEPATAG